MSSLTLVLHVWGCGRVYKAPPPPNTCGRSSSLRRWEGTSRGAGQKRFGNLPPWWCRGSPAVVHLCQLTCRGRELRIQVCPLPCPLNCSSIFTRPVVNVENMEHISKPTAVGSGVRGQGSGKVVGGAVSEASLNRGSFFHRKWSEFSFHL